MVLHYEPAINLLGITQALVGAAVVAKEKITIPFIFVTPSTVAPQGVGVTVAVTI